MGIALRFVVLLLSFFVVFGGSCALGQRPFTPKDDIELTLFEYAGIGAPGGIIKYSPDGKYFAVLTERGRLDLNAPEDAIWVFRTDDVRRFVQYPDQGTTLVIQRLVRVTSAKDGPLIEHLRWLPDSTGIAFTTLKKSTCCKFRQLFVVDIRTRAVKALTPEDQDVRGFDIHSDSSYVYEVAAPALLTPTKEDGPTAIALTGATLWDKLFPEQQMAPFEAGGLWVVDGHKRHVLDAKSYAPPRGSSSLSLSPDGHRVVAVLKAENPPRELWDRYKAPPGYEILHRLLDYSAYYLIDVKSGSKKMLVNGPDGMNQGWHSFITASVFWSEDGQSLVLPSVFFPLDADDPKEITDRESHPYIAVMRLKTGQLSKVLALKAGLDQQRFRVKEAHFVNDRTVVVNFDRSYYLPQEPPAAIFHQENDDKWQQVPGTEDPRLSALPIEVEKQENLNQPPRLVAQEKRTGTSRVLWDPNPEVKDIAIGSAEVIQWKDETGYEWEGGLVMPPDRIPGKRYPLVIQTHGFSKTRFLSDGSFSSGFAARALAARGIAVLQIGWNPKNFGTPKEAPDQVAGFESAVVKLNERGLIDPARVGVIGFSRSVYHVLAAITTKDHLFAAASVTDGVTFGYFEYIFTADDGAPGPDAEKDAINGGRPFGADGLRNWLAHSPEFNMDKVRTPLLLLQPGIGVTLGGWEPYAALRYLHKPVDLIMLQAGTHPMTNPTQRFNAETINVDWFCFWLKGEEDPEPSKAEQYKRWHSLRKLQEENRNTLGNIALTPSPPQ